MTHATLEPGVAEPTHGVARSSELTTSSGRRLSSPERAFCRSEIRFLAAADAVNAFSQSSTALRSGDSIGAALPPMMRQSPSFAEFPLTRNSRAVAAGQRTRSDGASAPAEDAWQQSSCVGTLRRISFKHEYEQTNEPPRPAGELPRSVQCALLQGQPGEPPAETNARGGAPEAHPYGVRRAR